MSKSKDMREPPGEAAGWTCVDEVRHLMELELAIQGYPDYGVTVPFPEIAARDLRAVLNKHFRVVRKKGT